VVLACARMQQDPALDDVPSRGVVNKRCACWQGPRTAH
jgi:hypothetical protein